MCAASVSPPTETERPAKRQRGRAGNNGGPRKWPPLHTALVEQLDLSGFFHNDLDMLVRRVRASEDTGDEYDDAPLMERTRTERRVLLACIWVDMSLAGGAAVCGRLDNFMQRYDDRSRCMTAVSSGTGAMVLSPEVMPARAASFLRLVDAPISVTIAENCCWRSTWAAMRHTHAAVPPSKDVPAEAWPERGKGPWHTSVVSRPGGRAAYAYYLAHIGRPYPSSDTATPTNMEREVRRLWNLAPATDPQEHWPML